MRMTLKEYKKNNSSANAMFIGIDLQNDFGHPNGSLYVKGGEELVEIANNFAGDFDEYQGLSWFCWTKDYHPEDHCSFKENGGIWPAHCVMSKWGCNFMNGLRVIPPGDIIIKKGTYADTDSYSAFYDNKKKRETYLHKKLEEIKIKSLFVMGIATDYCVKFTVLDALALKYKVAVYLPGCRGVDFTPGDVDKAIKDMDDAGAVLITE